MKKKLKKVIIQKVKKVVKPLAIVCLRAKSKMLYRVKSESKFYNSLRNNVTKLRKKNSKLPQLKKKTYPYLIEWLKKYDISVIKLGNKSISIYKAVETYMASVTSSFDNEDDLMDFVNKIIKAAVRIKFTLHDKQ